MILRCADGAISAEERLAVLFELRIPKLLQQLYRLRKVPTLAHSVRARADRVVIPHQLLHDVAVFYVFR